MLLFEPAVINVIVHCCQWRGSITCGKNNLNIFLILTWIKNYNSYIFSVLRINYLYSNLALYLLFSNFPKFEQLHSVKLPWWFYWAFLKTLISTIYIDLYSTGHIQHMFNWHFWKERENPIYLCIHFPIWHMLPVQLLTSGSAIYTLTIHSVTKIIFLFSFILPLVFTFLVLQYKLTFPSVPISCVNVVMELQHGNRQFGPPCPCDQVGILGESHLPAFGP